MPRRLCQLPVSLTMPRSTQPQHASCSRASLPTYPGGLVGTGPGGDSALLSKPGQAMAETASPVVTPANVLLARASHAAELTQGVGWSPPPQCRVAKGTDMGRVERQPSDNRGQVHGSAHTSPWPCTAQSRNSETMSSPGSARSQGTCCVPEAAVPAAPREPVRQSQRQRGGAPKSSTGSAYKGTIPGGGVGTPRDSSSCAASPPGPLGQGLGLEGEGLHRGPPGRGGCGDATLLSPPPILGTRRQSPHSSDMERPG